MLDKELLYEAAQFKASIWVAFTNSLEKLEALLDT
jgi:hypothetical protein